MKYLEEFRLFESEEESRVEFIAQPKKAGAKTGVWKVKKGRSLIGQIKWSSRVRGYAFLPGNDVSGEIKEFISDLMKARRDDKKLIKTFESLSDDVESVKSDIEDICLDLTDGGKFQVLVKWSPLKANWFVSISLRDHLDYDGFLLSEVEEVLVRIKEFLGPRRFVGCDLLRAGDFGRSDIRHCEVDDKISNVAIYFTI